jgi:hypothetical protein
MKAIIALSVLLITGCATTEMSPQQRRSIEVHTFQNANYSAVFRAFKAILQDEGYIIKNQDMNGGLIVATIQKTDRSSSFWAALSHGSNYRTGEGFEVSVNLERLGKHAVESRVTLQKLDHYSMGGQQGEEILDPKLYRELYQKVATEVARRRAEGRG